MKNNDKKATISRSIDLIEMATQKHGIYVSCFLKSVIF